MLKPYSLAQVQFQLGDEIGAEGRNSQVFLAYDPQLSAQIVIKKIKKTKIANIDEYFTESSLLYAAAHSNVVPICYACQDGNHIYLAMPYFKLGSVKKLMTQKMLSTREVVVLGTQFLSGLHHIHAKRLIHFDVKPDNILLSDRGEAVLSDFGLAKQMEYSGHARQDRLYSKMTPPEAFSNDQFNLRLDIYQAGLTLYRMSVGDVEFYRQYQNYFTNGVLDRGRFRFDVQNGKFPDRSAFPEHVLPRLRKTINKCLHVEPADRFSSVIEIVNELAAIEGNILDWRYKINEENREWLKEVNDKCYLLIVNHDGRSIATRKIGDGSPRRITEYCKECITSSKIRKFLREH